MRDEFSKIDKDMLAKRVAYKCSNPECRVNTIASNSESNKVTLIGIAAHINAASKGGPRFSSQQTKEERKSINNGIWLCASCSIKIDRDPTKYSKEILLEWKIISEYLSKSELNKSNLDLNLIEKQFENLLLIRVPLLKSLKRIQTKRKGQEIVSTRSFEGKASFALWFKELRVKSRRLTNRTEQLMVIRKFYSEPNPLLQYFENFFNILKFIKKYSSHPNYQIIKNSFTSQIVYYEKVLLHYYLEVSTIKEYNILESEFEIIGHLNQEDKFILE